MNPYLALLLGILVGGIIGLIFAILKVEHSKGYQRLLEGASYY